ncbi:MAG: manganese efflux pump [Bacilli bacterium]|jgi:putative Mn2+ efflux pump MntP
MNDIWSLLLQIVLIGIGLAMDAFAVSVCDGLVITDLSRKKSLFISGTFGLMQGIMPIIGFFIGTLFYQYIRDFDHWIAFALLVFIGGKMAYEGIKALVRPERLEPKRFSYKEVIVQGIATSIDALAVGISLCGMSVGLIDGNGFDWSIFVEALIIIAITFSISLLGILLGGGINKIMRGKYQIAEIIGGLILISIGVKIVLDHLVFNNGGQDSISFVESAISQIRLFI